MVTPVSKDIINSKNISLINKNKYKLKSNKIRSFTPSPELSNENRLRLKLDKIKQNRHNSEINIIK